MNNNTENINRPRECESWIPSRIEREKLRQLEIIADTFDGIHKSVTLIFYVLCFLAGILLVKL